MSGVDKTKIKFLPILDRNNRLLKIDYLDGSFGLVIGISQILPSHLSLVR